MALFQPGQSGNPAGRPKGALGASGQVKALARQHTEAAITALVAALRDPKLKVHAATALLDRGWGRPAQTFEGVGTEGVLIVRWLGDGEELDGNEAGPALLEHGGRNE